MLLTLHEVSTGWLKKANFGQRFPSLEFSIISYFETSLNGLASTILCSTGNNSNSNLSSMFVKVFSCEFSNYTILHSSL